MNSYIKGDFLELNVLWYYAIGFIIIWILAILFKDRLKIDIEGPILMRRTQRLRDFIDSIAKISPRSWRWTMNIGLPVAFFFMAVNIIPTNRYTSNNIFKSTSRINSSRSGYSWFTIIYTPRIWYNCSYDGIG